MLESDPILTSNNYEVESELNPTPSEPKYPTNNIGHID